MDVTFTPKVGKEFEYNLYLEATLSAIDTYTKAKFCRNAVTLSPSLWGVEEKRIDKEASSAKRTLENNLYTLWNYASDESRLNTFETNSDLSVHYVDKLFIGDQPREDFSDLFCDSDDCPELLTEDEEDLCPECISKRANYAERRAERNKALHGRLTTFLGWLASHYRIPQQITATAALQLGSRNEKLLAFETASTESLLTDLDEWVEAYRTLPTSHRLFIVRRHPAPAGDQSETRNSLLLELSKKVNRQRTIEAGIQL